MAPCPKILLFIKQLSQILGKINKCSKPAPRWWFWLNNKCIYFWWGCCLLMVSRAIPGFHPVDNSNYNCVLLAALKHKKNIFVNHPSTPQTIWWWPRQSSNNTAKYRYILPNIYESCHHHTTMTPHHHHAITMKRHETPWSATSPRNGSPWHPGLRAVRPAAFHGEAQVRRTVLGSVAQHEVRGSWVRAESSRSHSSSDEWVVVGQCGSLLSFHMNQQLTHELASNHQLISISHHCSLLANH